MLPSEYVTHGWTQNQNACDACGKSVKPDSPQAKSWDINGAMMASHRSKTINLRQYDQLKIAINNIIHEHYITWNDNKQRTHQEVIDMLVQAEQDIGISVK